MKITGCVQILLAVMKVFRPEIGPPPPPNRFRRQNLIEIVQFCVTFERYFSFSLIETSAVGCRLIIHFKQVTENDETHHLFRPLNFQNFSNCLCVYVAATPVWRLIQPEIDIPPPLGGQPPGVQSDFVVGVNRRGFFFRSFEPFTV